MLYGSRVSLRRRGVVFHWRRGADHLVADPDQRRGPRQRFFAADDAVVAPLAAGDYEQRAAGASHGHDRGPTETRRSPVPQVRDADSRRHRARRLWSVSQVRLVAFIAGGCGFLISGACAQAQRGQPAVTGGRLLAEVGAGALTTPISFI